MEAIKGVIDWFQAHNGDLILLVTSLIGTASIIVRLTPTPKDDAIFSKIYAFVSKFVALNKGK